jgi:hypothetical protein
VQSLLGLIPAGLMTIHFSLNFEIPRRAGAGSFIYCPNNKEAHFNTQAITLFNLHVII